MSNYITFRLTNAKKKQGTWTLKGGTAQKDGVTKFINYRPGSSSIFDDDNKDSAVKPQAVVFRYNDILSDPAVEVIVPVSNKILIDYLKAHPAYGVHYRIHDENELAASKIANYDKVEKALSYIKESEDIKIKAIALAVIGFTTYSKNSTQCAADLKELAFTNPSKIIDAFEAPNYEARYLAGLAFCSGVVKTDITHTTVIWAGGDEGVITPIAKGENGVEKLCDFLAQGNKESQTVLQEFKNRLDKATKKLVPKNLEEDAAKDAKIAELERKLAEATAAKKPALTKEEIEALTIEDATTKYKELLGKDIPFAKTKDLAWIKGKLAEA